MAAVLATQGEPDAASYRRLLRIYCSQERCPRCPHGDFWYRYRRNSQSATTAVRFTGRAVFAPDAIDRRSKEILELLLQGFRDERWKEELRQIERRREELKGVIAAAENDPPLPALHPQMAEVFRQKTERLAVALEHEDEVQRDSARQALRGFLERIVIPPGEGLLQVVGNLGEMLTAAGGRDGSAAVGYVGCGGSPPIASASLLDSSVRPEMLLFSTEVSDVGRCTLG